MPTLHGNELIEYFAIIAFELFDRVLAIEKILQPCEPMFVECCRIHSWKS